MKKLLFILSFILNALIANSQTIAHVTIISAPLSTTSIIDISCEHFDFNFGGLKKTVAIQQAKCLRNIKFLLDRFKVQKEGPLDTRGVLIIQYTNKKSKRICFDQFGNFFDGKNYLKNK